MCEICRGVVGFRLPEYSPYDMYIPMQESRFIFRGYLALFPAQSFDCHSTLSLSSSPEKYGRSKVIRHVNVEKM